MNPDGFPKVDVKYRQKVDDFYAWENEQDNQDAALIRQMMASQRRGFRVPDWVVALAALAVIAVLVWIFRQVIL